MCRFKLFVIAVTYFFLVGCSTYFESLKNRGTVHESQTVTTNGIDEPHGSQVNEDEKPPRAKLILYRSSLVASAVDVLLFDVTSGEPRYVGEILNDSQRHHMLEPGSHIFMIVAEGSIDYMAVNATSEKTYYSIIKPKMGMWKPSFSLVPIKAASRDDRPDGTDFDYEQYKNLAVRTDADDSSDPKNDAYFGPEALDKYTTAHQEWLNQAPEARLQKTLETHDGV